MSHHPSDSDPASQPSGDPAADHLRAASRQADDAATAALRARLQPLLTEFELQERVGKGGMGVVFRAKQQPIDRDVALKVMIAPPGEETGFGERFVREAQALAKLSHPGIVTIHSFGQGDGMAWIVMELVDGVSLRELLDGDTLRAEEAMAIVPQICEALQFAHDHGVVHRDVKPENVLVDTRGRVVLVDFGLAKLGSLDGSMRLTRSDQAMGTLRYMAPEQLDAPLAVDHRADIFSLGVVLYEMLTGQVPQGVIAPPSKQVQVDVRLDEVVLRSLEREPEQRFQRVAEVGDKVSEIRDTNAAVPDGNPPKPPASSDLVAWEHRLGRRFDAVILVLVLGALISLGLFAAMGYSRHGPFLWLAILQVGALGMPLFVSLTKRPEDVVVPMPFLRALSGGMAVLAVGWWSNRYVGHLGAPEFHGARAVLNVFMVSLFLLAALQFLFASMTRLAPGRMTWGALPLNLWRWIGVSFLALSLFSATQPWLPNGGRTPVQLLYGILMLVVLLDSLRPYRGWSAAKLAKGRAMAFSAAALLGVLLIGLSIVAHQNFPPAVTLTSCLLLGAVGAFAGAGSPHRRSAASA